MRHFMALFLALLLSAGVANHAFAEEQTERFIPIGQSPGLSGTATDVGTVNAYNPRSSMLEFEARGGSRSVELTARTRIWIDRSKVKLGNTSGAPADLVRGRVVEVKYVDPARKRRADWIKIEAAE